MIPLNSTQRLPPNALWYFVLRCLAGAILFILVGALVQLAASAPNARCSGLLCGTISAGTAATFMYLLAVMLVVAAVLRYKWFSFVLTDKSLSINAGVIFQRSTTFRFDKIQDIDTFRGPLRMWLGLKSIAIWTASLDQGVGNRKRPDGSILLDADTADWLKDYLFDPTTAVASQRRSSATSLPKNMGFALTLVVLALIAATLAVAVWKTNTVVASNTASASAAPPASVPPRNSRAHTVARRSALRYPAQSAAPYQAGPADYAVACAIHGSGGVENCADLAEAQRCTHEAEFPSRPTQPPAELTVVNRSDEDIKFYWLNRSGTRALYATLAPGGHVTQQSHLGAHWLVSTQDDRCVAIFDATTKTIGLF
jgi:membrane protein YdbS with pleckstrin-like domain